MSYLREHTHGRVTPQSEPIAGSTQVPNSAGGYSYALDCWGRLERFLVLGSEGGTYYVSERDLTKANVEGLRECFAQDGPRAVQTIAAISRSGRAPRNSEAIFALAMAAGWNDSEETRKAAFAAIPVVCRTGSHLFEFCSHVETFRGWGRGLRKAVAAWYDEKDPDALGYQMVKYRSREGWTHRDVLRSCHPGTEGITPSGPRKALYDFACGRLDESVAADAPTRHVEAFLNAQRSGSAEHTAKLIETYGNLLPREALLTEHMGPEVWAALLWQDMPMTALIRNLGNLSRHGVLTPMSEAARVVVAQLGDEDRIHRARVHPLAILGAMKVYEQGRGARGSGEWTPVPAVIDALDAAFYTAFANVTPTDKRMLLALDVSGSMGWGEIARMPGVTPATGAAAMALVTAATEANYFVHGFADTFRSLPITPKMRLTDAMRVTHGMNFGSTDCALPMTWALTNRVEVDAFVVYTDSETWVGAIHPVQALQRYREATGIDAKLIVVGMTATEFTIADPADAGSLDVVGFDSAAPAVLADFIRVALRHEP